MEFGKSCWRTFEQGIEKEWLLTNGIGGFACSTVIGANTRRYHGLLVASLRPPVERHLILSKLDESITINGKSYNLYCFKTPDYTMKGYVHLQRFEINPIPTFVYSVEDLWMEKKVCLVYGENTVVVLYHVIAGSQGSSLMLTPLVNFRDYHQNSSREHMRFTQRNDGNRVWIRPYENNPHIQMYCSDGKYIRREDTYFLNMEYPVERERGLPSVEDHYIPGSFEVRLNPGDNRYITVVATVEEKLQEYDGLSVIDEEEKRIGKVVAAAGYGDAFAKRLVSAADNFIVLRKSTGSKTILAGYPWFTDWGRDAMIAFTGLTLVTRRFDDAREILLTFAQHVRDGLIPNMFPDGGTEPVYNSVDAALWYFEAVWKYIGYTKDYGFVQNRLYPVLKEIIRSYARGTRFNIKMDEDCLISAGDPETQLTWMDAKAGGRAVTPRHGKAVEINALWYNALKVMSTLSRAFGEDSPPLESMGERVREAFVKCFWNEDKQCLYDVVNGEYRDDRVRPNQVLAVSLSYPVLEGERAGKVVERVWKELYTPYGLRSLSPESPDYRGVYAGDPFSRDSAYHQGTVWAWLLGPFITAYFRTKGHTEESRQVARMLISPLKDHLYDACLNSISEIFDGDEPYRPRGCFAQAWSVGEILRAYIEDVGV
ncbi:MAG: amylo-alpha-1,6-glucosidase [Clostridiales bacterium]|jgi:predicted glycogen debranching enzyme|nr:amylo-alpha-1,6-glucosidase [Eubacteriales bacterium]MDH7567292.1 amylo-alpha-1,6-glucosidase [Clostridiales bacterium]